MADAVIEAKRVLRKKLPEVYDEEAPVEPIAGVIIYYTILEERTMAITAGMVKELRETTGAGMMDCKKPRPRPTVTGSSCRTSEEERCGKDGKRKKLQELLQRASRRICVDGNKAVVCRGKLLRQTSLQKNEVFRNSFRMLLIRHWHPALAAGVTARTYRHFWMMV